MMKKLNGNLLTVLTVVLCLLTLTFTASAQKRRTAKKSTTSAASTVTNSTEIKAGAEKVSVQINNLAKFIFILGGVAKDIEAIDADINAKKITKREVIEKNGRDKQTVAQSIQNLRAGLAALEVEFRTKPSLKNYVFNVNGISDLAGNAEDQATSGRLTESGRTLLQIITKLSDTLVAMP